MDKYAILIGIAGGTGSGKTSVAKAIASDFGKSEVALIEQDSYYKDLSNLTLEERASVNFDHPDSVDYALMKEHINSLIHGIEVNIPIYDFSTHTRKAISLVRVPLVVARNIGAHRGVATAYKFHIFRTHIN